MDENTPPPLSSSTPPPGVPPATPPPPPRTPPPPVIVPAAAPRPPRRGRGWMVLAFILLGLLIISVLYNIGQASRSLLGGRGSHYANRTAGPRLDEVIYEDNDAADKIARIEIEGIITGRTIDQSGFTMVDLIKAQLKRAEEDERVKAVVLRVDSPGGEVLASDDINRAIADFQTRAHKPVVVSMGSLAASGGYYVSAPCRWIVANELTITGSIGVIMSSYNYRGLMDKVGLLPQTFKSGKYKDMLSGSREPDSITQEEKDMVQGLINETYGKFTNIVCEGRGQAYAKNKQGNDPGRALSETWTNFVDGRVLSGTEAYKLGFVDELGGWDEAVNRAKKLVGIKHANVVQFQRRYDLSDLFGIFGKSDAKAIKIDLGMDMPKLQAGQMYFLSPTFVH